MSKKYDATIIYYTCNSQDEEFEKEIRKTIKKNSDLPIVSVSHKPIDFGKNICVGDVGMSEFNMIRQILIGCEKADTKYVISAEADCLYPPDYFTFRPERDDACYRNNNTYIIGSKRDYYWRKKEGGTWCQVINREFYIKRLRLLLEGEPMWNKYGKRFVKEKGLKFFDSFETFTTENPCISLKAKGGMHNYSHSERIPIYHLPYWGLSVKLVDKYL
jgi:hypothetical protein